MGITQLKRKLPLRSLEKKLDKIFSEWTRRKDADEGGTVRCVTCGGLFFWGDVDAGHFIKRQHRATRWHPLNVAPQCRRDNHFMGGRQDDFANYIIREHGQAVFDELMTLKYQTKKHSRVELEEMIEKYQQKLKELG